MIVVIIIIIILKRKKKRSIIKETFRYRRLQFTNEQNLYRFKEKHIEEKLSQRAVSKE